MLVAAERERESATERERFQPKRVWVFWVFVV